MTLAAVGFVLGGRLVGVTLGAVLDFSQGKIRRGLLGSPRWSPRSS